MGEMSMGAISHNDVLGAHGVGIICLDHSECAIEHNTVVGTRTDPSGDPSRAGVAIEAHFFANAKVKNNTVIASPGGVAGVRRLDDHAMTEPTKFRLVARTGHPSFLDLPWDDAARGVGHAAPRQRDPRASAATSCASSSTTARSTR